MTNPWDSIIGTDEYNATLKRAQACAAKAGWRLNDDTERVEKVIGLMTQNFTTAGDYYCPCKQTHPLDPQNDVVCPCSEIKAELGNGGCCFCKLFFLD
ncbi:MAG: ferredoxin:thioredoxin reductase [Phycisphaerales bacterium]|jgi:ferredoxin-thioredoxin reductase catalytic subunit|nr:ferredoxin:thioredoxin reductase [Phycisphaerales bacterium]